MDRISCALLLGSVIGFLAPAVHAQGRSVPGTAVSAFPDEDPDGDDLLNSQEAERLTNPTNENSDGDSLVDAYDAMPNHAGFTFLAASEAPCAVIVLQTLPHPEAALRGINDQGDLLLVAPADGPPADVDAPRQEMAWLWRHGEYQAIGTGVAGLFAGPLDNGTVLYGAPVETEAVNNAFGTGTRLFSQLMRYDPSTGQSTAVSGQLAWEKMKVDGPVPMPLPPVPPTQGANPPGAQPAWSSSFAWAHSSSSEIAGGWMVDSAPGRSIMTSTLMRFTDSGVRTYDSHFSALGSWTFLGGGGVWPVDFQVRSRGFARNSSVFHTHGASINTSIDGQFPDAFWTNNSFATYFVHQGKGFFHNPFLGGSTIFDRSVELPGSETIYDLAPADEVFQSVVLGRDSQSGRPTLWGNTYGSFETCRLPAALPDATSAVIGRRISQTLQVPLVGGLWRNGRFVPAERLAPTLPPGVTNLQPLLVAPALKYPAPNLIAASVSLNNENRPALLLPVEMAVDANRDGVIKFAGSFNSPAAFGKPSDTTTDARPFRFWCNDDQDSKDRTVTQGQDPGSTVIVHDEGDVVPVQLQDSSDEVIKSKRDLEDFTRLSIHLGAFHEELVNGTMKVGLKWKDTGGTTPRVKIYRMADVNGSDEYLKEDNAALAQVSGVFRNAIGEVSGTGTLVLPAEVFANYSESNPQAHVLFEASGEGKGQLCITIHKGDGTEIGEGPGVWLDLKNIKKMYQRGKADPENIAPPQESVSGPFSGPVESIDDDAITFEADPNEEKKAVIFVHGWSMDYPNFLSFSETMFKRMWHQGFKGRFCAFRWDPLVAGGVYAGEYNRSEHRAFVYGSALKQFAEGVKGEGFSVSLAGHSMGNIVCSSALKQGLTVQNYLLMEAAVPAGCYDESGGSGAGGVNGYDRFWIKEVEEPTPDYHQVPNGELTKGYRGFFKGIGSNAGRVVNFHNLLDFALATGHTFGFETSWEKNEIDFKPDGNGATVWRYFYFPDRPLNERARLRVDSLNGRGVTDSYEMKAFVARPRSKAVGAVDASLGNLPSGAIQENINLQTYEFDGRESDHSGQFNRRIQEVDELYRDIHDIVK